MKERRRWLSKEEKQRRLEAIKKLRSQGWLYAQIGRQFDITGERVNQILKEERDTRR